MTIQDFLNDLKNKLAPPVPTFGPPATYTPRPQPIPVPPANAPLVPAEQPTASLVSSRDHARGRAEGSSLVGGR